MDNGHGLVPHDLMTYMEFHEGWKATVYYTSMSHEFQCPEKVIY